MIKIKKQTWIFIVVCIITIFSAVQIYFYISKHLEIKQKEIQEKLLVNSISKTKYFDTLELKQIGVTEAILKTKYIDGRVKYILSISTVDSFGIPVKANKPIPRYPLQQDKLILEFKDNDGFVIASEDILLNSLTYIMNDSGLYVGFQKSGSLVLKKEYYFKAEKWDLLWTF